MRKVLILGALLFASANVSALDNEDCKFVDALGQEVTEVAVSCADKKAEYSHLDGSGNPVATTVDLTDLSWAPEGGFSGYPDAGTGYTSKLVEWSSGSANCTAATFVPRSDFLFYKQDSSVSVGTTYKTTQIPENTPDRIDYYVFNVRERSPYGQSCTHFPGSNSYYVTNKITENNRYSIIDVLDSKFIDQINPLDRFADQTAGKYYGEFRAEPLQSSPAGGLVFEDWANGYGSVWYEMFDDGSELSGNVRIENSVLVIDNTLNTGDVIRLVGDFDLTSISIASMSIDVSTSGDLEASDSFFVNVSVDGGTTWERVLTMTDDYTGILSASFNPSSTQNTLIKLLSTGFAETGEHVKINSITIN